MTALAKARQVARRLRKASWPELCFRSRQELLNRWDALIFRLRQSNSKDWSVRARPSAASSGRFFFLPAELPLIVEILRQRFPEIAEQIVRRADRVCAHQFDLLGYKNLQMGAEIDWQSDAVHGKRAPRRAWYKIPYLEFATCGDIKITWELNRHQHFVTLGKAYQLTRDEKYAREFTSQLLAWQAQNPYPLGVNWASSLEVAFRSLSWIWARELFSLPSDRIAHFHERLLRALECNGRFIERNLSTYFSPNTHLLGEGVALFFIGTLCPELPSARRWQQHGWQIVLDAARDQVRSDGGYFEQSTYYHVYALDFFLHARILACRNQIEIPVEFDRTICAMLNYLAAIASSAPPPSFGDDDGGRVFDPVRNRAEHMRDPLSTGAVLYARPEFKGVAELLCEETLWLLGPGSCGDFDRVMRTPAPMESRAFEETGTYVLASPGLRITVDAGPLGSDRGGHGHADALGICVAADGSDWLSDQGTFTYTGSRQARDEFRGTGAHNTMRIDGRDQAEATEPFAWGRFPQVSVEKWIAGNTFDLLESSHDGYMRLLSPVLHRRTVFFVKDHFCLVFDRAEGAGNHLLEIFWHGNAIGSRLDSQRRTLALEGQSGFAIVPEEAPAWAVELAESAWSPDYGAKKERRAMRCFTQTSLPTEFATLLVPRAVSRDALGVLERKPGDRPGIFAFEYRTGTERHMWVFGDGAGEWHVEDLTSDARFAYSAQDRHGQIEHVVLCDGSLLADSYGKVLVAEERSQRIECLKKGHREQIYPSTGVRVFRRSQERRVASANDGAWASRSINRCAE
jgi:hypothetical protein